MPALCDRSLYLDSFDRLVNDLEKIEPTPDSCEARDQIVATLMAHDLWPSNLLEAVLADRRRDAEIENRRGH